MLNKELLNACIGNQHKSKSCTKEQRSSGMRCQEAGGGNEEKGTGGHHLMDGGLSSCPSALRSRLSWPEGGGLGSCSCRALRHLSGDNNVKLSHCQAFFFFFWGGRGGGGGGKRVGESRGPRVEGWSQREVLRAVTFQSRGGSPLSCDSAPSAGGRTESRVPNSCWEFPSWRSG